MLEYSVYANSSVVGHMAVFESPAEVIFRDVSTISLTRVHLTSFLLLSLCHITEIFLISKLTRRIVEGVCIIKEYVFRYVISAGTRYILNLSWFYSVPVGICSDSTSI